MKIPMCGWVPSWRNAHFSWQLKYDCDPYVKSKVINFPANSPIFFKQNPRIHNLKRAGLYVGNVTYFVRYDSSHAADISRSGLPIPTSIPSL